MIHFSNIDEPSQLVDALTGAALRDGAHKCVQCQVYFNRESVEELLANNRGRCVSCEKPLDAVV